MIWNVNSSVFSQIDDSQNGISIQLGNQINQELIFNISNGQNTSVHYINSGVKINEWHQITAIYDGSFSAEAFRSDVSESDQGLTHAVMYKITGNVEWLESWKRVTEKTALSVPQHYRKGYITALLETPYMNRDAHII